MSQMFARYPVLRNGHLLAFVAGAALAVVSLLASGDPAAAMVAIGGRR